MDQHAFQERVLDTLDEIKKDITAVKVNLAENYATKAEMVEARKEATSARRFAISTLISLLGIAAAVYLGIF